MLLSFPRSQHLIDIATSSMMRRRHHGTTRRRHLSFFRNLYKKRKDQNEIKNYFFSLIKSSQKQSYPRMASFTLLQTISSSSSQEESNRIPPTPSSPISFEFPIEKIDQLKENETLKKLKGLWKKVHSSSNYPKEKESLDLLGLNDEDGSFESCPPPYEEKEFYNVYINSKRELMLEEERQLVSIPYASSSNRLV